MIISGATIAHKFLSDEVEMADNVSCQLPSLDIATADIKGAGILGTINMPTTGQLDSMTLKIDFRSTNKNMVKLARSGTQNLELRFAKSTTTSTGSAVPEGTKIFATGIMKKFDPGKIENNATQDGSVEYELLRYRQVIDGYEVLLIDKQNYIYKVNGKDYMAEIRSLL